jgi:hypothetical protein
VPGKPESSSSGLAPARASGELLPTSAAEQEPEDEEDQANEEAAALDICSVERARLRRAPTTRNGRGHERMNEEVSRLLRDG